MTLATAREVRRPAGRDQLLVGGVDVTKFRGVPTPFPDGITYVEPGGYGGCDLSFPQIHPEFERVGTGETAWARKGAQVLLRRLDPATDEVVCTDYIGVVIGRSIQSGPAGLQLVLEVGGEVLGRLSLLEHPSPPFDPGPADVATWIQRSINRARVQLTPRLGTPTGIVMRGHGGGQTIREDAWFQQVNSMGQQPDGTQFTTMPVSWLQPSPYEVRLKDRTTVDFTLFVDGTAVTLDLADDAAGTPNVVLGRGTTAENQFIQNVRVPGAQRATPPPFPSSGSFGIGTTDAATTTGAGVSTLQQRLRGLGFRSAGEPINGTYDATTGAAVAAARRAYKTGSGTSVNSALWSVLFNIQITGFSTEGAYREPLAQADSQRRWNRSANGSIISANEDFDASELTVEVDKDYGANMTRTLMEDHAAGIVAKSQGQNWAGTITVTGMGGFGGQHGHEDHEALQDPSAASLIVPFRDFRAGQNVWVPNFDGGTLFHIAQVNMSEGGATLMVDVQARDAMELSEIIDRNMSSMRSPRRERRESERGKTITRVGYSDDAGYLEWDYPAAGDDYTVIPFFVGQQGTVAAIEVVTKHVPAEFVVAIFGRKVTPAQLRSHLGNPFTRDSQGRNAFSKPSNAAWLRRKGLLAAWGDSEQPGGYWPGVKKGENGATGDPVTGHFVDESGFEYLVDGRTGTAYLVIYPDRDTVVDASSERPLLRRQEDDAF